MMKNIYIVPLAIIFAGALIGGGLAYGLSRIGSGTSSSSLPKISELVKLDLEKFHKCLETNRYVEKVESDLQDAIAAGGGGTPYTVFIDQKGNTLGISGAQPYENIKSMIDASLKGKTLPFQKIYLREVTQADHVRGEFNAPLTFVEYSDTECPFCKRFHETMQNVIKEYPGKVRWIYRHFPLVQLHPKAPKEAQATECAGEQGRFWEYLDRLFEVTPSNNNLDLSQL